MCDESAHRKYEQSDYYSVTAEGGQTRTVIAVNLDRSINRVVSSKRE